MLQRATRHGASSPQGASASIVGVGEGDASSACGGAVVRSLAPASRASAPARSVAFGRGDLCGDIRITGAIADGDASTVSIGTTAGTGRFRPKTTSKTMTINAPATRTFCKRSMR